ncbi:hypothetical protein OC861_003566 [Tilletia horrida]|nr:hypothetical protein OC861_003566 [Tilletia horrida]
MVARAEVRAVADVPVSSHAWPTWTQSILDSSSASVVVEVFHGLEDTVQRELRLLLEQSAAHVQTKTAPGCAHILIEGDGASAASNSQNAASVATALHLLCRLPTVRASYLLIHHRGLPQALLDALHDEVSTSGAKEAKNALRKQPLQKSNLNPKPFLFSDEPIQTPWTTNEEELLRFIKRVWDEAQVSNALSAALGAWTKIFQVASGAKSKDQGELGGTQEPRSFRLTFERGQYLFPRLRGCDVEKEAADLVSLLGPPCANRAQALKFKGLFPQAWRWLNNSTELSSWKVDLRNPDLDITLKMVPSLWAEQKESRQFNVPGSLAVLFRLPVPPPDLIPLHRRNLSLLNDVPNSTALLRYRAAALSLTATLPICAYGIQESSADVVSILEPCCGTGGLAVELAAALQSRRIPTTDSARYSPIRIYACDVDARLAQRAAEVFQQSGFAVQNISSTPDSSDKGAATISAGSSISLISDQVDSSKPSELAAFVHGPESVDLIMTDLPWGYRVSAQRKLIALYTSLLTSFSHVLKEGAYCYLVAASPNVFFQALQQHQEHRREASADRYLQMVSSDADREGHHQTIPRGQERTGLREIQIGYSVFLCILRNCSPVH